MSFKLIQNRPVQKGDTTLKFGPTGNNCYISAMATFALDLSERGAVAFAFDDETQGLYIAKVPEEKYGEFDVFNLTPTTMKTGGQSQSRSFACRELSRQTKGEVDGKKYRILGGEYRVLLHGLTWYFLDEIREGDRSRPVNQAEIESEFGDLQPPEKRKKRRSKGEPSEEDLAELRAVEEAEKRGFEVA